MASEAKRSSWAAGAVWIASSLSLLAMTVERLIDAEPFFGLIFRQS